MSSLALPIINGGALFSGRRLSSSNLHSSIGFKRDLQKEQRTNQFPRGTRSLTINVLADPNVTQKKARVRNEVIMVDPVEAKRLAAKAMEKIKAKEKFKRQSEIEAINGAWAMIGLTVGLVIEGQTGNSIPEQLVGYLDAFVHFFVR